MLGEPLLDVAHLLHLRAGLEKSELQRSNLEENEILGFLFEGQVKSKLLSRACLLGSDVVPLKANWLTTLCTCIPPDARSQHEPLLLYLSSLEKSMGKSTLAAQLQLCTGKTGSDLTFVKLSWFDPKPSTKTQKKLDSIVKQEETFKLGHSLGKVLWVYLVYLCK